MRFLSIAVSALLAARGLVLGHLGDGFQDLIFENITDTVDAENLFLRSDFACGSMEAPEELLNEAKLIGSDVMAELDERAPLIIKTHAHIVTSPKKKNRYNRNMITRQIQYMNRAYRPAGIQFRLASLDHTVNSRWAAADRYGDFNMKKKLRKGKYRELNLYFCSDLTAFLGQCYFPTNQGTNNPGSRNFILDGCVVFADSLAGGQLKHYNLGGTAAHETGHWFGLLHVFQGDSCSGRGDYIPDTPQMASATRGCPKRRDSCPGKKGLDPIHNYMDYSYDRCYSRFSPDQRRVMRRFFKRFRAGK